MFDIALGKIVRPFASLHSFLEYRPALPPATHFTPMAIARRWPTITVKR